jgi:hypothetical protein
MQQVQHQQKTSPVSITIAFFENARLRSHGRKDNGVSRCQQ